MVGAALGTLPDLDVLLDYGNDVANFTYHRGFSHSLIVLTPFSVLLWWMLKRFWRPVQEAPLAWFFAITLALVTHPLLDAHTVYGTQLWWPFPVNPTMWSTLFIIDPLYTLPLLAAGVSVFFRPTSLKSRTVLLVGLSLSQTYLAWSWLAKYQVTQKIQESLSARGIPEASFFSTPTPMNTLMWRAVALTDQGYIEGLYSLPVDRQPMQWRAHGFDRALLRESNDNWALARLRWFSSDFISLETTEDRLVAVDLRMGGLAPNYIFRHQVAKWEGQRWDESEPQLLPVDLNFQDFGYFWERLWDEFAPPPDQSSD